MQMMLHAVQRIHGIPLIFKYNLLVCVYIVLYIYMWCMVFTDPSAEAFALKKYLQLTILGHVSVYIITSISLKM